MVTWFQGAKKSRGGPRFSIHAHLRDVVLLSVAAKLGTIVEEQGGVVRRVFDTYHRQSLWSDQQLVDAAQRVGVDMSHVWPPAAPAPSPHRVCDVTFEPPYAPLTDQELLGAFARGRRARILRDAMCEQWVVLSAPPSGDRMPVCTKSGVDITALLFDDEEGFYGDGDGDASMDGVLYCADRAKVRTKVAHTHTTTGGLRRVCACSYGGITPASLDQRLSACEQRGHSQSAYSNSWRPSTTLTHRVCLQ